MTKATKVNEMCLHCDGECKQDSFISITHCPVYRQDTQNAQDIAHYNAPKTPVNAPTIH